MDNDYGLRLQPGSIETEESCEGCKRLFKTTRGVKQHQRLSKCLEMYRADRINKSKVVGIQDKHHSDTNSRLPVIRPLTASGGAKSQDDTLQMTETSPEQDDNLEKANQTRQEERHENQEEEQPEIVAPGNREQEIKENEPQQSEEEPKVTVADSENLLVNWEKSFEGCNNSKVQQAIVSIPGSYPFDVKFADKEAKVLVNPRQVPRLT